MRVYTVGHSTHSVDHLIGMLRSNEITSVCDIRSMPYSRYTPQFNREAVERNLRAVGLRYLYLGEQLGGRSKDEAHYSEGRVQYSLLAKSAMFREGLDWLHDEMGKYSVALMCTEKDPMNCHRAILVTREFRSSDSEILHIRPDGTVETNDEFEGRLRLAWKLPLHDMFGEDESLISQAYELQANKIAYSTKPGVWEERSDL